MLLVPSLMRLMRRAGWWIPHWLDVIMPNISIEGEPETSDSDEPTGATTDSVPIES